MRTGLAISAIAHACVLLVGLVTVSTRPLDAPPTESLPVDIISVDELSRLSAGDRNAPKAEAPKPVVEKVAEAKPAEDPTAKVADKPEIVTASATPAPPSQREPPKPAEAKPASAPKPEAAEPKPSEAKKDPEPRIDEISEILKKDEKKKPEPKKEAAKAPPPKPKPPQPKFDANRIAALLDKRDPQRQAATGAEINRTAALGTPKGFAPRLSQDELDALRARLRECWLLPAGAADAKDLAVEVRIQLKQDGSLASEPALVRRGSSPYFQVAAESALRAVRRCAPFDFLPATKYEIWRDIEVTFDPRDMYRG